MPRQYRNWFVRTEELGIETKRMKPSFKPIPTRTQCFARSAIPQIAKLANSSNLLAYRNELVLRSGQVIVV